uniref:Sulfotransferase n=1 Tax=Acrobeloides nanus TaxID=290746 RepID=A0A914C7I1_9BILA
MRGIMCYLYNTTRFISLNLAHLDESHYFANLCNHENDLVEPAELFDRVNRIFLRDWTGLIITRDPIDRFLSAFIDICINDGYPCNECYTNITCFIITHYEEMRIKAKVPIFNIEEGHFTPQNWRCNPKNLTNAVVIPYSHKDVGQLQL